jgi:hypothetical protein
MPKGKGKQVEKRELPEAVSSWHSFDENPHALVEIPDPFNVSVEEGKFTDREGRTKEQFIYRGVTVNGDPDMNISFSEAAWRKLRPLLDKYPGGGIFGIDRSGSGFDTKYDVAYIDEISEE